MLYRPKPDAVIMMMQVGATPEGVEVPRCVVDPSCLETIEQQLPGHKATVPTGADPKWRFFWRLGPRPSETKFAELNAEPVIPQGGRPLRSINALPVEMRCAFVIFSEAEREIQF